MGSSMDMKFDSISPDGNPDGNNTNELIDLGRTKAICNFKEEFDSPNDFFMKRKESKLKLKIRKALTSLKTIITPKTRLETSESMINPDTTTEQGKDTVTPRKTASETL